jgi:hypothetical protein
MPVSLRASMSRIADPRNLDASVSEVFCLMLGVNCELVEEMLPPEDETVSGGWIWRSAQRGMRLSGRQFHRAADGRAHDRHWLCGP